MRQSIPVVLATILLTMATITAHAKAVWHRVVITPGDHFGIARLERAAERGQVRAQTQLGFMHETGRGVPQDYIMAAWWYRQAAEQGYPPAQHLLGLGYNKGHGVPLDYVEAHKWLNLSAVRANAANREYFARLRTAVGSEMSRSEIATAQRRTRVWYPKRAQ